MIEARSEYGATPELTAEMIRAQLELLVRDEVFRSSKRSVAFLKYVVEQTLNGSADQIKERTIGVEVFGRDPSYDTNLDHIVRTAATELRKRLASYYVDEKHRSELRMELVPGSYIPRFTLPGQGRHSPGDPGTEAESAPERSLKRTGAHTVLAPLTLPAKRTAEQEKAHGKSELVPGHCRGGRCSGSSLGMLWLAQSNPPRRIFSGSQFWTRRGRFCWQWAIIPTVRQRFREETGAEVPSRRSPALIRRRQSLSPTPSRLPGWLACLEARNKQVLIRRGNSSSFSDLERRRGGADRCLQQRVEPAPDPPVALQPGAWIRNGTSSIYGTRRTPRRAAGVGATNQPREPVTGANSPKLQDFALISRIRDSETGHVVVVIGGLYTYGTEAAGEFLTDPRLMQAISER